MSARAITEAVARRLHPKPPHSSACRGFKFIYGNTVCLTCGRTLSWGSR